MTKFLIPFLLICSVAFAADREIRPLVSTNTHPVDYVDSTRRGTVDYAPEWRNYSWHRIKVPNGTVITEMNFSQLVPDTDAFVRTLTQGYDLTFIDCNLTNVRTYPDWTIINSNTAQVDMVGRFDDDGIPMVDNTVFVASQSSDVDSQRIKSAGALE